ncbi:unnamed protein product [Cuscuta epithymum]|uniref:Uncharacterized protein n=1 Tax=Cuscuta epithymum TaxID=186058 RepID=A0AAV0EN70_9ASTE|nr:unnamed protein product [Cuscuta epithymum]
MEEALKAAYAEVILNTVKEAAARVMGSEQKARRLEKDLQSTKDESIRLLLRLKLMADAKVNEAETSAMNQQRRIDELEAQLNEAEGLVLELREELNTVREEFDETKKEKNKTKKKNVKDDPVLSSMVMKCKEAVMYRSPFTQRICAVEMSSPDVNLNTEDDPCFAVNIKPVRECGETKNTENHLDQAGVGLIQGSVKKNRPASFHGETKRKSHHGEKVQKNNGQSFLVRRSARKRKIKYWDVNASVWRSDDYHSNQSRKHSRPCRMPRLVKCNVKSSEDYMESNTVPGVKDHVHKLDTEPDVTDNESEKASQRSYMTSDQANAEGQLKYTFFRKRKKDSLTNPKENSSGEKLYTHVTQQDSSVIGDDSPRKNRQLVQIANQLISLSGKLS